MRSPWDIHGDIKTRCRRVFRIAPRAQCTRQLDVVVIETGGGTSMDRRIDLACLFLRIVLYHSGSSSSKLNRILESSSSGVALASTATAAAGAALTTVTSSIAPPYRL